MRARRRALSSITVREHSQAVVRLLQSRLDTCETDLVACYFADDHEIDLSSYIESLLERKIRMCMPVVRGREMYFSEFDGNTKTEKKRWGIREPTQLCIVEPWTIDILLAPVVAYSPQGERLGRGGGYYDRALRYCERALYVGVAHSCQRSKAIKSHKGDIPLDAVVTEQGAQVFRPDKQRLESLSATS